MMIRHSNSFLVSFLVHTLLAIALFFAYKTFKSTMMQEKGEKVVCVNLSCVKESPPPVAKKTVKKQKATPPPKTRKKIIVKKKKVIVHKSPVVEAKEVLKVEKVQTHEVKKEEKSEEKVANTLAKQKAVPVQIKKQVVLSAQEQYVQENIDKIVALLQENLYYPRRARKRGVQGDVVVQFTLSTQAKISQIKIISSKSEVLSRGAIQTIKNIEYKLPKPKEKLTFTVPISYSLH